MATESDRQQKVEGYAVLRGSLNSIGVYEGNEVYVGVATL
jgi:hypothetical protein